jgi:tRNA(fMet)-specific endonuclease VapC
MEIICIDSSVLIDHFRNQSKKTDTFFIELNKKFVITIPAVVWYEIHRGSNPAQDTFWDNLQDNITILPFDKDSAETAGEIYKVLKKMNKLPGTDDILISAIAKRFGFRLATLNPKHFENIPDLDIIRPTDI